VVFGGAATPWFAPPCPAAVIEATASNHGRWTRELAFGNLDVAAAVQRASSPSPAQVTKKPEL
jgi:hypothetical protein